MSLLLTILVICLVVYVAFYVIGMMGIPDPMNLILRVIVGVVALVYLFNAVGGMPALS